MTIILAIEDEPSILENVLETLELGGFKALGAPDGLAGLELARQHLPDLIISDVMMPGMDGYDVLLALRSEAATASIPFIFLTARAERAAVRQAMEFGADDYLVKPFTTSELLVAVTSRLTRHAGIAQEQQDKLKDLRGNLLHMLPHELRTPLNAVLGYAELLVADAANMDPGEIVDMAGRIQKGGLRLLCLVENFLLMAQIEIVKSDPEWLARLREGSTPRPEVVIRAVAEKKAKQANREGDLVLDLADAGAVQASEDNLRKLVEELLDNAFKFSKAATQVYVTAEADGDRYCVQITDQGRGMTREQIAAIGPYMQFERKLYEQQGSGLGLSVAQALAELHGGKLNIESAPNQGTLVSVLLPIGTTSSGAAQEVDR